MSADTFGVIDVTITIVVLPVTQLRLRNGFGCTGVPGTALTVLSATTASNGTRTGDGIRASCEIIDFTVTIVIFTVASFCFRRNATVPPLTADTGLYSRATG